MNQASTSTASQGNGEEGHDFVNNEMLQMDMRIQDELDRQAALAPDGGPRDYSNGSDWIHCIPFNPDGSQDMLQDISFKGTWTLSSCKTERNLLVPLDGYGIHELLHESVDKYWQSDGPQPHTVTIEFPKKTDISFLFLYLDFKNDESYTPNKVVVYLGSSLMHLDREKEHEFTEPNGWQGIDLRTPKGQPSRAFVLQLQIVQNHQNGRDTHVRHIRVAGPVKPRYDPFDRMLNGEPSKVEDFENPPISKINDKLLKSMTIR